MEYFINYKNDCEQKRRNLESINKSLRSIEKKLEKRQYHFSADAEERQYNEDTLPEDDKEIRKQYYIYRDITIQARDSMQRKYNATCLPYDLIQKYVFKQ